MPTDLRLPIPHGWIHVEPPQPDLLVMMSPPGPQPEEHATPVAAISRLGLPVSTQRPGERLL
ncbi:MAG: hypothetical protein L0H93_08535, partial [Nocardioides sp.]|nr:hypothetical protein [Nocardioides sp.]